MTSNALPLLPLKTVLFPGMPLPLHIFEERHQAMFDACLSQNKPIGVVLIASGHEVGGPAAPYPVGTTARIVRWERLPDRRIKVLTVGERRFRVVEEIESTQPYLIAAVEYWDEEALEPDQLPVLIDSIAQTFAEYLTLIVLLADQALPMHQFQLPDDPSTLSYHIAMHLQIDPVQKQHLLEEPAVASRLRREVTILRRERDFLQRLVSLRGIAGQDEMFWGQQLCGNGARVHPAGRKDSASGQ
jgi:Lon protease-like protein